jgi:hypothetical protein
MVTESLHSPHQVEYCPPPRFFPPRCSHSHFDTVFRSFENVLFRSYFDSNQYISHPFSTNLALNATKYFKHNLVPIYRHFTSLQQNMSEEDEKSPSVFDLMRAMQALVTKVEELSQRVDQQGQPRDSTFVTPPQSIAASEPAVAANAAYKVVDAPRLASLQAEACQKFLNAYLQKCGAAQLQPQSLKFCLSDDVRDYFTDITIGRPLDQISDNDLKDVIQKCSAKTTTKSVSAALRGITLSESTAENACQRVFKYFTAIRKALQSAGLFDMVLEYKELRKQVFTGVINGLRPRIIQQTLKDSLGAAEFNLIQNSSTFFMTLSAHVEQHVTLYDTHDTARVTAIAKLKRPEGGTRTTDKPESAASTTSQSKKKVADGGKTKGKRQAPLCIHPSCVGTNHWFSDCPNMTTDAQREHWKRKLAEQRKTRSQSTPATDKKPKVFLAEVAPDQIQPAGVAEPTQEPPVADASVARRVILAPQELDNVEIPGFRIRPSGRQVQIFSTPHLDPPSFVVEVAESTFPLCPDSGFIGICGLLAGRNHKRALQNRLTFNQLTTEIAFDLAIDGASSAIDSSVVTDVTFCTRAGTTSSSSHILFTRRHDHRLSEQ